MINFRSRLSLGPRSGFGPTARRLHRYGHVIQRRLSWTWCVFVAPSTHWPLGVNSNFDAPPPSPARRPQRPKRGDAVGRSVHRTAIGRILRYLAACRTTRRRTWRSLKVGLVSSQFCTAIPGFLEMEAPVPNILTLNHRWSSQPLTSFVATEILVFELITVAFCSRMGYVLAAIS